MSSTAHLSTQNPTDLHMSASDALSVLAEAIHQHRHATRTRPGRTSLLPGSLARGFEVSTRLRILVPGAGMAVGTPAQGAVAYGTTVPNAPVVLIGSSTGDVTLALVLTAPSDPSHFSFPLSMPPGNKVERIGPHLVIVDSEAASITFLDVHLTGHDRIGRPIPASLDHSGRTLHLRLDSSMTCHPGIVPIASILDPAGDAPTDVDPDREAAEDG